MEDRAAPAIFYPLSSILDLPFLRALRELRGENQISADFFIEAQRAHNNQDDAHDSQNERLPPEVSKARAAQDDAAHDFDQISRGQNPTDPLEEWRHVFNRKDVAAEKDRGHHCAEG